MTQVRTYVGATEPGSLAFGDETFFGLSKRAFSLLIRSLFFSRAFSEKEKWLQGFTDLPNRHYLPTIVVTVINLMGNSGSRFMIISFSL